MGVSSNLEVFLSEKPERPQYPDDSSLSVGPAMETHHEEYCQASKSEDNEFTPKQQQLVQERDQEQDQEDHHQEQESNDNIPKLPGPPLGLNYLKLEIPSYKDVEREEDDSNEGFKTPKSHEHKIPTILQCPPAPRKPKTSPSTKRKVCRRRIALDLTSQDIESLFPTLPAVDLGTGGNNNKRLKLFAES